MSEILELIGEKVMHGLFVCLIAAAVVLLGIAVWNLVIYYLTRSRVTLAKQIYHTIQLGEPSEKALAMFRDYGGNKDRYTEETLLTNGEREIVLCLQFWFGRGEMGEIRLTYVGDRLVQKKQNGIW